jgi:hypothetical protein
MAAGYWHQTNFTNAHSCLPSIKGQNRIKKKEKTIERLVLTYSFLRYTCDFNFQFININITSILRYTTYQKKIGSFGKGLDWICKIFKIFFLKITPIFLLFISHQSLFIIFQIKKSLQNKKFYFSKQKILLF